MGSGKVGLAEFDGDDGNGLDHVAVVTRPALVECSVLKKTITKRSSLLCFFLERET
jgi:hypothetical protein